MSEPGLEMALSIVLALLCSQAGSLADVSLPKQLNTLDGSGGTAPQDGPSKHLINLEQVSSHCVLMYLLGCLVPSLPSHRFRESMFVFVRACELSVYLHMSQHIS